MASRDVNHGHKRKESSGEKTRSKGPLKKQKFESPKKRSQDYRDSANEQSDFHSFSDNEDGGAKLEPQTKDFKKKDGRALIKSKEQSNGQAGPEPGKTFERGSGYPARLF